MNKITKGDKLPNRCDNCSRKNIGCDRMQPKCRNCIKSKLECTFQRPIKKINKLHYMDKNLVKFSVSINSRMVKDTNPIFNIYDTIQNKYALHNILVMLQYPSPFQISSNVCIVMSLVKSIQCYRPKANIELNGLITFKLNERFKIDLLNRALSEFELYNRTQLMLFHPRNIKLNERSEILVDIIYLFGLTKLECNKEIINYYENKVKNHYLNLMNIRPSLDNLQGFLIVLYGLRQYRWIDKINYSLVGWILRVSQILGLPFSKRKHKKYVQLERQLAYNLLHQLLGIFSINSFFFSAVPYKCKTPCLDLYISFSIHFDSNIIANLIFNDFISEFNNICFCLSQIKCNIYETKEGIESLKQSILRLLKREDKIHNQYIGLLNQYCNNETYFTACINLYHYYISYFIHSILFFNATDSPTSTMAYKLELYCGISQREWIIRTLDLCLQCLKCFIDLPLNNNSFFIYAFINQPILFLLRYKSKLNLSKDNVRLLKYNQAYELCKQKFLQIIQSPFDNVYAQSNLRLIDTMHSLTS
ncbi:hypothetical protein K502DRAFT_349445 [Neoconidiobolus thromboides FSU 785]|nr:hypothetical protein K502DRAFT_349445 [Neoconidiobolus thromboides FSU 785]